MLAWRHTQHRDGAIYHARLATVVTLFAPRDRPSTLSLGCRNITSRTVLTPDNALPWAEAQLTIHFDALALAAVCESPTP